MRPRSAASREDVPRGGRARLSALDVRALWSVQTSLSYSPLAWLTIETGADVAMYRDARSPGVFVGVTLVPYHPETAAERTALARR